MPRPGPRPYECIKRAWHSDRHQPMRGSIIQQIFRLVAEAHSSTTRKNKEWQEKLPVVVLKAEEIMYSKANSEEEYADPETLWTRVKHAVDTIIRRDEDTETGELLPPCVEAALNLGCIPVRTSRSQRHSNPRIYLSPKIQEPLSGSHRALNKATNEPSLRFPSHNSGKLNSAAKPGASVDVSDSHRTGNNNAVVVSCGYPFSQKTQMRNNQLGRTEANVPVNLGSVYPLYSGANNQTERLDVNSTPIIVGMPVGISVSDQGKMDGFQNLFSHSNANLVSEETGRASSADFCEKPLKKTCDLSLRLGLSSEPCTRLHESSNLDNIGCSSFEEGRFAGLYPGSNKEFCFFPGKSKIGASESGSSQWFSNSDCQNSDVSLRKRKVPFGDSL